MNAVLSAHAAMTVTACERTALVHAAGFLSPASRGALLTALLVMYLLLAVAAGFAAVYLWGLVNRRSAPRRTPAC